MYEEGRKLYTEEINAAVRGAKAGGATEIVVMDCHGAGGGWTFNSLDPGAPAPGLRVGRAGGVDRLHRVPRAGLRRRALRRHARDGRHAAREHEPHRLGPRLPGASGSTASRWARPGSTPPSAAPGAVRSCSSPATRPPATRGRALLGEGLTTVAVKKGLRCGVGAPDPAGPRAAADRGGCAQGSRRPEGGAALRPGQPLRDQGRVQAHPAGRPAALPPRRRADRRADDRRPAPTRGGRPGTGSSSRKTRYGPTSSNEEVHS